MQQLTIDDLIGGAGRAVKPDPGRVPVNVTVSAEDEKRLSGQAWDIYQALLGGAKFNVELVALPTHAGRRRFIHNMTARISEIREYLSNQGLDVLTYRLPEGVWLYRIGPRQSSSRQIGIEISSIGRSRMWNCPCCQSIAMQNVEINADPKSVQKSIEQNPLCPSCQTRLESSSCPRS